MTQQRIADKIADFTQKNALLVTVDNQKLGLVMESSALIASTFVDGKWRPMPASKVLVDEDSLAATSALLEKRVYKDLSDFDNHLDELTQDYLNVAVNIEIDKCL